MADISKSGRTAIKAQRAAGATADAARALLDEPLRDEASVLDVLVAALSAGQAPPELFQRLHDAAIRDDRVANLSFAYERLIRDPRIQSLPPARQAELHLYAAAFFADVFGDQTAALPYALRAHALEPTDEAAFGRLESLLIAVQDGVQLAKVYSAQAARQTDLTAKLDLLKRAVEILEAFRSSPGETVALHQEILTLDPTDGASRSALEKIFVSSRRFKELATLLEDTLAADPPSDVSDALRLRLTALYRGELRDAQRAAPHVEKLLGRDPVSPAALQAAEALLDHRGLAQRLAPLLSDVYRRLGRAEDEATTLALELKFAKPPRALQVHRRLAILRQDVLQDPSGALELLEPLVARDPADSELRRRYLQVSATFHRQIDAARLLTRALTAVKDPATRASVGLELAALYQEQGEARRAERVLEQVLQNATDDAQRLSAAKRLAELHEKSEDNAALAVALEIIVRLDNESSNRVSAARRLAELCDGNVNDPQLERAAWRTLIHSPKAAEALDRLQVLCQNSDDSAGLAEVFAHRAEREKDPVQARYYAFRAVELLTPASGDATEAIAAWQAYIEKYGATREVYARMIPLLERQRAFQTLASVLEHDAELAPPEQRAQALARLAHLELGPLGDVRAALKDFRRALVANPKEATCRRSVEMLLNSGPWRLPAADILEPLLRAEADTAGVVRVLRARGEAAASPEARLGALGEAVSLAEGTLKDPRLAVELCGPALGVAARQHPPALPRLLARFSALSEQLGDPVRRSAALVAALGELPVDSPPLAELARTTAEALVATGEGARAVDVYRRALAYEPSSAELVRRIDELLAEQGTAEERVHLYQSALDKQVDPARRRDLMHSIARLQRVDMDDVSAAVASWRRLIAEHPGDLSAHEALVAIYEELGDLDALLAELARGLDVVPGVDRAQSTLKMAQALGERGEGERALPLYREVLGTLDVDARVLSAIEMLCDEYGDLETLRQVLERRATVATDPTETVRAVERLGDVLFEHFDDPVKAVAMWREAAELSRKLDTEQERARRLYERILQAVPGDRDAAAFLVDAYAVLGNWLEVRRAFRALFDAPTSSPLALEKLLQLADSATQSGAAADYLAVLDEALAAPAAESAKVLPELMRQRARLLATLDDRADEAARAFRKLIELGARAEDLAAFGEFLDAAEHSDARIADRRWLFEWRAQREPRPATVLLEWAVTEEQAIGDLPAALAIYERVLSVEPDNTHAIEAACRLRAAGGDFDGFLGLLTDVRDRREPEDALPIDLQRAAVLIERLDREAEGLAVLDQVLETAPREPEAIRLLLSVVETGQGRVAAANLLESASLAMDEPREREELIRAMLEVTRELSELQPSRARWFDQWIQLCANDGERALAVAVQAAEQMPDAEALWESAEHFARRVKKPAPVATAYERVLDSALTAELAETLGRRMVEFHEEWFDEPERVLELLERVLELSPRARWALDRVKLAFNADGRWDELFKLYDNAIAQALDGKDREDLLDEAALAAKDLANDLPRAIRYLEELLALRVGDTRLESTLERLYERTADAEKLLDLLGKRLSKLDGVEKEKTRARVASLWLDLGKVSQAFRVVDEMLEAADAPESAFQLLERILTRPSPASAPRRRTAKKKALRQTLAGRAAALLKRYYGEAGRTADLVRVLEAEMPLLPTQRERVNRLQELVELKLGELSDASSAFGNVADLIRLEPKNAEHRRRLHELSQQLGRQAEHARLLEEVVESNSEGKLKIALLKEAAAVYRDELENIAKATELYQHVLELAAGDSREMLAATRELDDLLQSAGRIADRCTVLEQMAAVEREPAKRRGALREVARLASEELEDPAHTRRVLELCLELEPKDLESLSDLEQVLTLLRDWRRLTEVLQTRAGLVGSSEARRDLVRAARLVHEELSDRPAAIELWRTIRRSFGEDDESFDALVTLLQSESRWQELTELVRLSAAGAQSDRRSELYRLLGDVYRDRMNDPLRALGAYVDASDWALATEVAQGVTEHEAAKHAADALLGRALSAWEEGPEPAVREAASWAVGSLAHRLTEEGAHERVVELQLRAGDMPFPRTEQRQFRRDAAWTSYDRLGDRPRAIQILTDLFEESHSDEVAVASVGRFSRVLEEEQRYSELAELWQAQAQTRMDSGDRAGAAALWARAAQISEARLGDLERAVAVHRRGAACGGEASLEALARIYNGRKNYRAASIALEWLCAQSARELLAERTLALAETYVKLGERERAIARLERAAAVAIEATEVRARLAALYELDEAWRPLAELLVEDAARASDPRERLGRLRQAAELHLDRRADPESAIPLLEQAVEVDTESSALRVLLSRALSRAGRHERATEILKAQIDQYGHRKPKERALVHLHLARVSLAAGGRAEALGELEVASRIDPAHPEILHELSRLALEENQLDRAEKNYRALLLVLRRPGRESDSLGRAEVYLDLSEIASRQGDGERAAEYVESAFECALENETDARSLERALRHQGRFDLLTRAIEKRLEAAAEPVRAARALSDLVLLHAERRTDAATLSERVSSQAERIYVDLEKESPPDDTGWTALSQVFEWLGDSGSEAKVLERRVSALLQGPPEAAQAEPLYRLAELRLADRETQDEGVRLLEQALEARPDFARAEQLLVQALASAPPHPDALRLLEQIARTAGNEDFVVRAMSFSAGLGDFTFAKLKEGTELGSSLGDEASVLRMLRGAEARIEAFDESEAQWIYERLGERLERAGEFQQAADALEQAATRADGAAARALWLRLAWLCTEQLDARGRAARVYAALLEQDPGDRGAWQPLLDVYRKAGERDKLIGLIESTVPRVDSVQDRGRLRLEEATLMLERDADSPDATRLLQGIIDEDPSHQEAAVLLGEILERQQRFADLTALYERLLEAARQASDAPAVEATSLKLGARLEEQGKPSEAILVYESLLESDPASRVALRCLVALPEAGADADLRRANWIERLIAIEEPERVAPLARSLVALRTAEGDAAAVLRALQTAFSVDPTNPEIRERLAEEYEERGSGEELARLLHTALEAEPEDRRLLLRAVEAYAKNDQRETALEVLTRALESRPADAELLFERAQLYAASSRPADALTDLEAAHASSGQYVRELVTALEAAIDRTSGEAVADHTIRLVDALEKLGQTGQARERLTELLKLSPKHRDALRRLAWLASSEGRWEEASGAYRRLIPLESGDALVSAAMNLADACERSDRLSDARGGLERALQVAPDNEDLRARLRAVYEEAGAHRELGHLYLEQAAREAKVSARTNLLLHAAELLLDKDGDAERAVEILDQVLKLSPSDVRGAVLMSRALSVLERADEALGVLQQAVAANRGRRSKDLSHVYREISNVHLETGDMTDALGALSRAFDMDMRDGELAMQLGHLALDLDDHAIASRAFRSVTMMKLRVAGSVEGASAESKAVAYYHLSRIARSQGDVRKARLMASKAVSENPGHEDAQALLEELRAG